MPLVRAAVQEEGSTCQMCVCVRWQEEMGLWACKVPTLGLGNCVKGVYKFFYSIREEEVTHSYRCYFCS